jgi:hypothetical protein
MIKKTIHLAENELLKVEQIDKENVSKMVRERT